MKDGAGNRNYSAEVIPNGRAFIFNEKDGSISPRDEPTLFLGRRGDKKTPSRDQLHLIHSIHKGNLENFKHILNGGTVDVNVLIDGFETTILGEACRNGQFDMVRILLKELQADPNVKSVYTALVAACYR